jgi:hypothetical protein
MGSNFHTPWVDTVTEYKQADMNAPLSTLDRAIGVNKNLMIYCEGEITYDKAASGELAWDDVINIAYIHETGDTITNKVNAGSVIITDDEFAYVTLSDIDGATLTVSKALIAGDASCNFATHNIVVLAVKSATSDEAYYVNLKPHLLGVVNQAYDVGGSFSGKPSGGQMLLQYPMPRQVTLPADFSDSQGVCETAATDDNQIFDIKKDATKVGSMIFNSGETTAWFSGEGGTDIVYTAGEVLKIEAPTPADADLENIGFAITGWRA